MTGIWPSMNDYNEELLHRVHQYLLERLQRVDPKSQTHEFVSSAWCGPQEGVALLLEYFQSYDAAKV